MELPPIVMPSFPQISFSAVISTPVLILILVVFSFFYAIVTGVLIYHWSKYGMRSAGILVAETLFLFVSLSLFVFAGLAISYF